MIAKLRPYPAYKDSGVEWLGQVPEHWEILPNRSVYEEVEGAGSSRRNDALRYDHERGHPTADFYFLRAARRTVQN